MDLRCGSAAHEVFPLCREVFQKGWTCEDTAMKCLSVKDIGNERDWETFSRSRNHSFSLPISLPLICFFGLESDTHGFNQYAIRYAGLWLNRSPDRMYAS